MTVGEFMQTSTARLEAAANGTARLDVLVLLEDALRTNRTQLLAHPERSIPADALEVLSQQVEMRSTHEPLAYIRGKTEFYGREFIVTPAVLEPRPESETMIELLLKQPDLPPSPRIADVGTGSGALGITAFLELQNAVVDLLEIDNNAIKIAKMNVIKHTTHQNVIKCDLLAQAPQQYNVLLCNLPYVPDNFQINEAALREPHLAVFGGSDGLDLYRKLFEQIQNSEKRPLLILCESLPPQHETLAGIAAAQGYYLRTDDDFIQCFEYVN